MFKGEVLDGSEEEYETIKNSVKNVFKDDFFEADLQDGSYITLNSNIIQQSIFRLNKV